MSILIDCELKALLDEILVYACTFKTIRTSLKLQRPATVITKVIALSLIIIARVSLVRLLKNVARVARFQVITGSIAYIS